MARTSRLDVLRAALTGRKCEHIVLVVNFVRLANQRLFALRAATAYQLMYISASIVLAAMRTLPQARGVTARTRRAKCVGPKRCPAGALAFPKLVRHNKRF
jgi:hypothetical protein